MSCPMTEKIQESMFHLMFIELHFFIVLVMAHIYQNNTFDLSKCMIRIFTIIVYEHENEILRVY